MRHPSSTRSGASRRSFGPTRAGGGDASNTRAACHPMEERSGVDSDVAVRQGGGSGLNGCLGELCDQRTDYGHGIWLVKRPVSCADTGGGGVTDPMRGPASGTGQRRQCPLSGPSTPVRRPHTPGRHPDKQPSGQPIADGRLCRSRRAWSPASPGLVGGEHDGVESCAGQGGIVVHLPARRRAPRRRGGCPTRSPGSHLAPPAFDSRAAPLKRAAQGTTTLSPSRTHAGLSLPSSPTVVRASTRWPALPGVTDTSSTPARMRPPTGTGVGNRRRSAP